MSDGFILTVAFTDEDIKELQSSGEIVVAGHTLTMEDIKLLYTVDPAQSSVYEAHSDGKVSMNILEYSIDSCTQ